MSSCVFYSALIVSFTAFGSCRHPVPVYENITAGPDKHPPHTFEGRISFYDTVAPATVHIRDPQFYDKFSELMWFSDEMPSDDTIRVLSAHFSIDTLGRVYEQDKQASERQQDFDKVYQYLMGVMSWTPAHLKRDPNIKVPVWVWLSIHVEKDSVKLYMDCGTRARCISRDYPRPLSR